MSQKQINLYDDSVLKLSIKQGTENDRFPVSFDNNERFNREITGTLPSSFTMAEPVFTRDTGRVFIGDFTDKDEFLVDDDGNQKIQQTLGGTLVGNKYLGFIDSKPPYNSANDNSTPRSLTSSQNFIVEDSTINFSGCLVDGSDFRTYNYLDDSGAAIKTEDGKWSRQSFYNSKYDAYDGDYMYDIYRNALIIFDHNIKPGDGDLSNKKRIRSKIDAIKGETEDAPQTVFAHTTDMYGDGYVCLYNVIPDGDTLTFDEREFNTKTGEAATTAKNYTQNIIKVQKVYADAIENALNATQFQKTINASGASVMSLRPSQKLTEIYLESDNEHLMLPNRLGISENFKVDIDKFIPVENYKGTYSLTYNHVGTENNINHFKAALVPDKGGIDSLVFRISLGDGLCTASGEKEIVLSTNSKNGSIELEGIQADSENALVNNPFNLADGADSYSYSGNIGFDTDGRARFVNTYSESYNKKAESVLKLYDNINCATNYLNYSVPIFVGTGTLNSARFVFETNPVIYCSNTTGTSSYNVVSFSDDITITNNKGYSSKIGANATKKKWLYFTDNKMTPPDNYIKSNNLLYLNNALLNPINKIARSANTDSRVTIQNLNSALTIKKSKADGSFIINDNISSISKLYFNGDQISDLYGASLKFVDSTYTENDTEEILNTGIFYTTDLWSDEPAIFEVYTTDGRLTLLTIPSKKYFTKIEYDEETNTYNSPELAEISNIIYHFSRTEVVETGGVQTRKTTHTSSTVAPAAGFLTGDAYSNITNNLSMQLYGIELVGVGGEKYIFNLSDDIEIIDRFTIASSEVATSVSSTEEVDYQPALETWDEIFINETNTMVKTIETFYYENNTTGIDDIFDAPALYYYEDAEGELRCLIDDDDDNRLDDDEIHDWINQRKTEVMSSFPMVPQHATSIIVECKTGSNSSLKINYIGNAKADKMPAIPDMITVFSGITIPATLNAANDPETWTTSKELVSLGSDAAQLIELPISIDTNNKRHITIDITSSGNTSINLAGYKA